MNTNKLSQTNIPKRSRLFWLFDHAVRSNWLRTFILMQAKKEITVSYWPIIADPIFFHISFDTHIIQRLVAKIIYVFCRNDFDLPPWSNSERCQACERLALNSCGSGMPKNYLFWIDFSRLISFYFGKIVSSGVPLLLWKFPYNACYSDKILIGLLCPLFLLSLNIKIYLVLYQAKADFSFKFFRTAKISLDASIYVMFYVQ